ncbi:polyphenol oxidase family protein [Pendulispora albinea]|uniref:Polyphenol oxidase family protein n=1 Tax=Pendulispora albinea TaxID=2741071 RepID=A0ABZ2LT40_9BACT
MRFGRAAGIAPVRIAQARQVHGIQVVDAKTTSAHSDPSDPAPWSESLPEADAIVAEPGTAAGVRVADCVPILVGDPGSGIAAAIHAGWRGTVAGVVQSAVDRMASLGADPARAVAAIGPCICVGCFEVGDEVAERIVETCGDPSVIVRRQKPHADLRAAVRLLLARAGIGLVEDVPGCTRCEKERFFSYRRGQEAGRQLAAILAPAPRVPRAPGVPDVSGARS